MSKKLVNYFTKEPLFHYHMDRFLIKSPAIYRDTHRVIHIGGGPNRNHPREININVVQMEHVDIVGDTENLPLKDNSIDALICNAVLEHVKDLDSAVGEFNRVLKPGGLIYIEIPFMQHYHTHDIYGVEFEDYRRLTKSGLIHLFNFCIPVDVGVCVGPTSTVFQILFTYLEDLSENKTYKRMVNKIYRLFGNLFVWVDGILPQSVINNSRIPSGIYYFGRKKAEYTTKIEKMQ
jgi:SAM-dependent methyltransferase